MLRAGLRRLLILVVCLAAATAVGSVLVGAIMGTPLLRALSVGFYAVGSFGLVAGFFVGNRGPARGRAPTESSPFGGVKDSGLGVKEGVIEAMNFMTTVKTFSLPW